MTKHFLCAYSSILDVAAIQGSGTRPLLSIPGEEISTFYLCLYHLSRVSKSCIAWTMKSVTKIEITSLLQPIICTAYLKANRRKENHACYMLSVLRCAVGLGFPSQSRASFVAFFQYFFYCKFCLHILPKAGISHLQMMSND